MSGKKAKYVLDSFAILAYLTEEEGADVVEDLLNRAESGGVNLYLNYVNLGEVYYITVKLDINQGQSSGRKIGKVGGDQKYNMMSRCYFCNGKVVEKKVKVDFRWGDELVVIEDVPAEVCQQCGEKYLSPEVYKEMENLAKTKENPVKHIAIDVIRFVKPARDKVKSL